LTLLNVVKDVCAKVGVQQPTSVFSNIAGNRTMTEMLACANEAAQAIAYDQREWTRLTKGALLTGDGIMNPDGTITGTESFNLPADYLRMTVTASVWRSTSAVQPMRFVMDADEWQQSVLRGYFSPYGQWMLQGGQMHILPILAGPSSVYPQWRYSTAYSIGMKVYDGEDRSTWLCKVNHTSTDSGLFTSERTNNPTYWISEPPKPVPAQTARFIYIDKNCIGLNSGGFGDTFLNDADTFRLGDRLLKLGMIFSWKQSKGSPYAEDMNTFSDALAFAQASDRPAPILLGRRTLSSAARIAYPFDTSQWGNPVL